MGSAPRLDSQSGELDIRLSATTNLLPKLFSITCLAFNWSFASLNLIFISVSSKAIPIFWIFALSSDDSTNLSVDVSIVSPAFTGITWTAKDSP